MKKDNSRVGKSVIEDIKEAETIAALKHYLEEWKDDRT